MKVLLASTPATGHLNPLLAIGRVLLAEGHEVVGLSGSALRERIEAIGAEFRPLPAEADFDPRDLVSVVPELKETPPGPEWLRTAMERIFVDPIPAQYHGLLAVLRDFEIDAIVADDMFYGVLPLLLGPRAERAPVILCGTSILHFPREDGAPNLLGLPAATSRAQVKQYAAIARQHNKVVEEPVSHRLNRILKQFGVGPLSMTLSNSAVALADSHMQLTVPSFEFPRDTPASVHFVGVPPIIPNQVPPPSWAHELDGSRKAVLVTQGTVADEPDVLALVTTGGRPLDAIPGPIPDNARLATYLPFEWALPKVDVLVTNGGYGTVNQALSFGVPLVSAGLTEDKADVNARVAWSGVGIDLAVHAPTPDALREAIRTVLDKPAHRSRAQAVAQEFALIDTRSEILRIIDETVRGWRRKVARNNSARLGSSIAPADSAT
jgi:UDP:flavonoid glycosyltransferase YjiC (YdhE family)